jgi:hypothetical protein
MEHKEAELDDDLLKSWQCAECIECGKTLDCMCLSGPVVPPPPSRSPTSSADWDDYRKILLCVKTSKDNQEAYSKCNPKPSQSGPRSKMEFFLTKLEEYGPKEGGVPFIIGGTRKDPRRIFRGDDHSFDELCEKFRVNLTKLMSWGTLVTFLEKRRDALGGKEKEVRPLPPRCRLHRRL